MASSSDVIATPTPTASITSLSGSSASQSAAVSSASDAIKSLSSVMASASAAISSESAIAAGGGLSLPSWMKWLGLCFAVGSGFLIGSSFVFKKKGLLAAQKKYNVAAGESMAYLKSPMWWIGMSMMILGEILNLVAYAVTSAVLVTPLGALSVVICAILSSIFLNEKLTLFGKIGCFLCIVGSTVIALNGPSQHAAGQIKEFQKMFVSVGFLVWAGLCIASSFALYFIAVPRWGKKNMLVHISICSLIGGLSVSTISGVGSAIVLSIQGDNQFKYWFIYFLIGFVCITLVTEIIFLNKALELFNTAMVTPTYYVLFTFCTLVTSIILFQGLDSTPIQIVTIVLGFLTICAGITLLQISKIDPQELVDKDGVGMDRSTTFLIRASQSYISHEKGHASGIEDPGVDAVRGGLGVIGSIVRARSSRRIHNSSADEYSRMADEHGGMRTLNTLGKCDLERYELHDRPMPKSPISAQHLTLPNLHFQQMPQKRDTTISFISGSEDPHGHHANSRGASAGSTSANVASGGGGGAGVGGGGSGGGILMSPTTSQTGHPLYHTEPASYRNDLQDTSRDSTSKIFSGGSTIRPIGPRIPRSDGADDLRKIWVETDENPSKSPGYIGNESGDDDNDEARDTTEVIRGDDSESTGSASPTISKRSGKIFSHNGRKVQSKEQAEDAEEEELLSPVMRSDLQFASQPSNKRRSMRG